MSCTAIFKFINLSINSRMTRFLMTNHAHVMHPLSGATPAFSDNSLRKRGL